MQRYQNKITFTLNCIKEYILDICFMRSDPIAFKTAEFVKRNFNSIRNTLNHLIYEMRKIKMGFRTMRSDIGFAVGFNIERYNTKYTKVNVMER